VQAVLRNEREKGYCLDDIYDCDKCGKELVKKASGATDPGKGRCGVKANELNVLMAAAAGTSGVLDTKLALVLACGTMWKKLAKGQLRVNRQEHVKACREVRHRPCAECAREH
jgi:hypothetical protein